MIRMPKPVACTIDLTEACNLRCDYCFTWSMHKPRTISDEMGKRIIDWWLPQTDPKHERPIELSFWGGEPLLQWDRLKRLWTYARRKAVEVGRDIISGGTTNGVLYTPDKVEWCRENKALMLVSLDGLQNQHDTHRKCVDGSGSWKLVINNLKKALDIAPDTHVRMSLVPEYAYQFLESVQFLHEELGVRHLAFSPVMEADWTPESIKILKEQFLITVDYYLGRLKDGHILNLKHFMDEAAMGGERRPQNPCGAGNGYMGWSVDGYCFPCHRFNKHDVPSEQRGKLPTIIARPKGDSFEWCNHEWREQFVTFKDNPPKQCDGCDILGCSVCNGGCYAVNYDIMGDLKKVPEFECAYNRLQHDTGRYMEKRAKEMGINLNQGDNHWDGRGCICFNMCYHEGMPDEIIHINRAIGSQCLCNVAAYNGEKQPPNTRGIQQILVHKEMRNRFIELSRRIIETVDQPKSPEQKAQESVVLQKTVGLLLGDPSML